MFIRNIGFFGYSDAKENSRLYKQAFNVAKAVAEKGYVIVNGGGPGVMYASTKGAAAANGETISVTFSPKNAPGFEGIYLKNTTDKQIKTSNYIERMFKLFEHADTYIIFQGGTGTLSEFATTWCLARLYYGYHKPFILYGAFWKKIVSCLEQNLILRGNEEKVYKIVTSPKGVLQALDEFEKEFAYRLGHISISKKK
jgi:uncharacterized protein (TIGR00730 family)